MTVYRGMLPVPGPCPDTLFHADGRLCVLIDTPGTDIRSGRLGNGSH
jgi:hypothetical protein